MMSGNPAPGVVVVDASIAVKWVLNEQSSTEARTLLRGWLAAGIQPIAPAWFGCEIVSVLYQHMRKGTVPPADARIFIGRVLAVVATVAIPSADFLRAFDIALLTAQRQPYDAQYLALAERLGCEYWTDDVRFVQATAGQFPQVRPL